MSLQARYAARELRRVIGGSLQAHQALQDAVLQLLALWGLPAVPIHTGPRVSIDERGTVALRGNAAQRGLSDVLTCLPPAGRLVLLELKTGSAVRSPEQREVHARFTAAGALCLEVRDVGRLGGQLGFTGRLARIPLPAIPILSVARGPLHVDPEAAQRFVAARLERERRDRHAVTQRRKR